MTTIALCSEILNDFSHLQLSRQKTPNYMLSVEQIRPISEKVNILVAGLKISHNPDTEIIFQHLVYPLAQEIIRQNIEDLDDLIKNEDLKQADPSSAIDLIAGKEEESFKQRNVSI